MLRNCAVDFVENCNVCARKAIIEAAKRIINSDKVCHSYSDLNFGVTFLEHSVELVTIQSERPCHQQRLLQTFAEDVFIFSLFVYIAHQSFLDDVLYKFTYLLTYLLTYMYIVHISPRFLTRS